jgi:hypothetical protein
MLGGDRCLKRERPSAISQCLFDERQRRDSVPSKSGRCWRLRVCRPINVRTVDEYLNEL